MLTENCLNTSPVSWNFTRLSAQNQFHSFQNGDYCTVRWPSLDRSGKQLRRLNMSQPRRIGFSFPRIHSCPQPIYVLEYQHVISALPSSGEGAGGAGGASPPPGKIPNNSGTLVSRFFSNITYTSLLLSVQIHVYCALESTLSTYKINKLFLATSCFSLWELVSNWLTWKFWLKTAFKLYFINFILWD